MTKQTDPRLPLLKDLEALMVKHKMIRFQFDEQWLVIVGENKENDSVVRLNPNESFDLEGVRVAIAKITGGCENG